ncbi:MAG: MBL fold metallo-hydrolase [Clostridiales bacterium]|nr:MBL fold metallo-hydrolase [Clostridiales bacterium]
MDLTFLGAAHEVTGSCFYLEACGKKMLIDCGMIQGHDVKEEQENLGINASQIDYVFLTHAHIDHTGRMPLLSKRGFHGEVYATSATCDLCEIMLRDSAHIQEFEMEWHNRKAMRSGAAISEPLYNMEDAENVLKYFKPCTYDNFIQIAPGLTIKFIDVGHLLGSASIEIYLNENNVQKKLVFSGDVGNKNQPILKDPTYIHDADYIIMESTYGDRNHEAVEDYRVSLSEVIKTTFDRGGNVVIPSFAVGRTQELLYFLRDIQEKHMVKGYSNFPVYVDSPLAIEAIKIFGENIYGYFDDEAMELVKKGINPISFPSLKTSVTSDESRAINFLTEPAVIISSSGMCEAGRIKHHLKHNLWRPECTIVFVGFQAQGTLGRALLEGAKKVKLFGEDIEVKAQIKELPGISGHADRDGLVRWLEAFNKKTPERVFVVHGERDVSDQFAEYISERFSLSAVVPDRGDKYDLALNTCVFKATPSVILEKQDHPQKDETSKLSPVFAKLVAAGNRLLQVVRRNEHGANKDLTAFTDQINSLSDKWDR